MTFYTNLLRPMLFALSRRDPEAIHEHTLGALRLLGATPPLLALVRMACAAPRQGLRRNVFGLSFPNPLGLAAGFDKNALALPAWGALGFGFVEVGTVTQHPQAGNPRPRLFRLPADEALINRMGFNNAGSAALAARLAAAPRPPYPLGISLGKSKVTPLEQAADDYTASLRALYPYGDYFAVNVSSPNTPGLRALQEKTQLDGLLATLMGTAKELAGDDPPRPVLLKLAPDLSDEAIDDALQVAFDRGIAGLIATNTTVARTGLRTASAETGGLSGRPLAARARAVVALIARRSEGRLPIIGVGGIATPDDAQRMFDAGAMLLQAYTGFVYQGPRFAQQICRGLRVKG